MRKAFLGVLAALLLCAQPAWAAFGISSVTPSVVQVSPPLSADKGDYISTTEVRVWHEGASTLGAALPTDHDGSPVVAAAVSDLTAGSVVGAVRSFMIHFDPGSVLTHISGSITFDQAILGLFRTPASLVASDGLGVGAGTAYPDLAGSLAEFRGLELLGAGNFNGDRFTISADRKTLTLNHLATSTDFLDEMRVVTAVPEVATIGSWGLLGLGFVVAARRKWLAK